VISAAAWVEEEPQVEIPRHENLLQIDHLETILLISTPVLALKEFVKAKRYASPLT
jgi:hypothetical protein